MSLTVTQSQKSNIPPIPEGTYVGVCYMMADLGMQYNEKWGKAQPKVQIGWELPDETVLIDGEEKPRIISQQYTASLNEKSRLRKDLISWRGRDFTPEELERFDLKNIVGTSCFLNVIHREYNGRTFASVSNVMALPKGMPKGKLSGEPLVFDFDTSPLSDIIKFPSWLADVMMKSETYAEKMAAPAEPETYAEKMKEDDGELPF